MVLALKVVSGICLQQKSMSMVSREKTLSYHFQALSESSYAFSFPSLPLHYSIVLFVF